MAKDPVDPASLDIKFPAQHYVTFQKRPEDGGELLGFLVPDGDDAPAAKRKLTADEWAARGQKRTYVDGKWVNIDPAAIPAQVLKNTPKTGFTFGDTVQHGYRDKGDVKWRVSDPRGFMLEVSAGNVTQIMRDAGVERGGAIQGACVWARLGNQNILVPVESEVYATAIRNTQRAAKSVSAKDVSAGDRVVLQNGKELVLLGKLFPVNVERPYDRSYQDQGLGIAVGTKRKILHAEKNEDGEWSYSENATLKISEILEKGMWSPEEVARRLLEMRHWSGIESGAAGAPEFFYEPAPSPQCADPLRMLMGRMSDGRVGEYRPAEKLRVWPLYEDYWAPSRVRLMDDSGMAQGEIKYLFRTPLREELIRRHPSYSRYNFQSRPEHQQVEVEPENLEFFYLKVGVQTAKHGRHTFYA